MGYGARKGKFKDLPTKVSSLIYVIILCHDGKYFILTHIGVSVSVIVFHGTIV
jgi:hypothetical protein